MVKPHVFRMLFPVLRALPLSEDERGCGGGDEKGAANGSENGRGNDRENGYEGQNGDSLTRQLQVFFFGEYRKSGGFRLSLAKYPPSPPPYSKRRRWRIAGGWWRRRNGQ